MRSSPGARIRKSAQLQTFCSRCALTAGGPPAVPVKRLSGDTTKGEGVLDFCFPSNAFISFAYEIC